MSLYAYGAIRLENDTQQVEQSLLNLSNPFGWQMRFPAANTTNFDYALALPQPNEDYLIFEIPRTAPHGGSMLSAHTSLFGELYEIDRHDYYCSIAKNLQIKEWDELDFMSNTLVNIVYQRIPYPNLPINQFLSGLITSYPNRHSIFAIDHDFINEVACEDIHGDYKTLAQAAWQCIALGYSRPNLRLIYNAPQTVKP